MSSVYIRPLVLQDALVSYQWRNNPRIWRFTGNKPDKYITPEIETEWLKGVLQKNNDRRFAICTQEEDRYIGNVFFTDITDNEAEIHIFIGEIEYWGKRRAYDAICLIAEYGFTQLSIKTIIAKINRRNLASKMLAEVLGAKLEEEYYDEVKNRIVTKWIFTREMYDRHPHVLEKHNL